jgi:hypothetical protein
LAGARVVSIGPRNLKARVRAVRQRQGELERAKGFDPSTTTLATRPERLRHSSFFSARTRYMLLLSSCSLLSTYADWGDGHFIGVVRALDRIRERAWLDGVTPHVLGHSFASVAGDKFSLSSWVAG